MQSYWVWRALNNDDMELLANLSSCDGIQTRTTEALFDGAGLCHRIQYNGTVALDRVDPILFDPCGSRGNGLGMSNEAFIWSEMELLIGGTTGMVYRKLLHLYSRSRNGTSPWNICIFLLRNSSNERVPPG